MGSAQRAAKYSLESFGVGFMVTSPGFQPAGHTCAPHSRFHDLFQEHFATRYSEFYLLCIALTSSKRKSPDCMKYSDKLSIAILLNKP